MIDRLPPRVLAWYGDDFTGSTDVLEMLSLHGLPAVLFLKEPSEAMRERFANYRAFGLAGSSRSRSPKWMDSNLPAAFQWLAGTQARVIHYKVCSTFDSSPEIGNIGRALEIGQRVLGSPWVPIVVGAPALGRYTAFGHLFAAAGDTVHRIDRHPTMSCHPVTPMHEADLRLHLSQQTAKRIGLMSFVDLASADPEARLQTARSQSDAVLFDVMDEKTLTATGRLLWTSAPLFVVGSSGVEHSLAAAWKASGLFDSQPAKPKPTPTDQLLVLSGSCSPVTLNQVAFAIEHGFVGIPLMDNAVDKATVALAQGSSVVIYSALTREDVQPGLRDTLANMSGRVLAEVLDRSHVKRVIIAGGDTSSRAGAQLDIEALTFLCSLTPGAPLCRAWSSNPRRDGLEIVFKGGQCGQNDFFVQVLAGS